MNEQLNWISLGTLMETTTDFSDYSKHIGVYRAILNGKVVYIGKATELNNGGFRKRLRDYTRSSSSARNYPAGELMYKHKNEIQIDIIVFGQSLENIADIENIETRLIREEAPIWNSHGKEK